MRTVDQDMALATFSMTPSDIFIGPVQIRVRLEPYIKMQKRPNMAPAWQGQSKTGAGRDFPVLFGND